MDNQTKDNSVPSAQNGDNTPQTDEIIIYTDSNESNQLIYSPPRSVQKMDSADKEWMLYIAKINVASRVNKDGLKEADYILMLMKAYEMGVPFTCVAESFYIVNGKICIDSRMMLTMLHQSPLIDDVIFDESTPDQCTVTIKRKGKVPVSATFTMKDAETAGLLGKAGWKNYPNQMLAWRALSKCARRAAPDILLGTVYTKEELLDADDRNMTVSTPKVSKSQTPPPPVALQHSVPKPTNNTPVIINAQPNNTTFSNGENPPPPVELDPLAFNPTPAPVPASGATDLDTLWGVQKAIEIYGESHWFIKHRNEFLAMLRRVIPNQDSMTNGELNSTALKVAKLTDWKGFAKGSVAFEFVCQELGVPVPKMNNTPAPQPQPEPSEWEEDFSQWLWDFLDMPNIGKWEELSGKKVADYRSYDDAVADAKAIAQAKQWTVCSYEATYVKKGEKTTYIEFKGIFPIRMYGRSSTFKTQVGEAYYTTNGVDKWEANHTYKIEGLRITWGRDQNGTAIANKVEPVNEADFDLTPEELNELASVDM